MWLCVFSFWPQRKNEKFEKRSSYTKIQVTTRSCLLFFLKPWPTRIPEESVEVIIHHPKSQPTNLQQEPAEKPFDKFERSEQRIKKTPEKPKRSKKDFKNMQHIIMFNRLSEDSGGTLSFICGVVSLVFHESSLGGRCVHGRSWRYLGMGTGGAHLDQMELKQDMGVSENRGKTPKMDGENNGKPY